MAAVSWTNQLTSRVPFRTGAANSWVLYLAQSIQEVRCGGSDRALYLQMRKLTWQDTDSNTILLELTVQLPFQEQSMFVFKHAYVPVEHRFCPTTPGVQSTS